MGDRRGGNQYQTKEYLTDSENYEELVQNIAQLETGAKTRAIAAKKAGFRGHA